MPVLKTSARPVASSWPSDSIPAVLLSECANSSCRSGWFHPWRNRKVPVFEGGWTCSAECTRARLRVAIAREMDGQGDALQTHRHRIPLGLLMLQQGWISHDQLRAALEAQRASGSGRLGQWLVHQRSVSEEMVTKALGLQWSCPVLTPELQESSLLSVTLPRLFLDAFEALPLRLAAGKVLYLGFEERLDPVLALALERMGGVRVECAIVRESSFRPAHRRMLASSFPSVELVEAASGAAAAHALGRALERSHSVAARLVRVHDCLWLRMWSRVQKAALPETETIHDVLCSIGPVR